MGYEANWEVIILSRKSLCGRVRPGSFLATLFVALTSGCATTATTTVHQHPDIERTVSRIEKIAILPVEVGQLRLTALGEHELQLERERTLRQQLTKALRTALLSRSYSVVTEPEAWPGDEVKPESPEARQLRSEYLSVSKNFQEKAVSVEEARQLRASVGSVATTVAAQQQADALLIVRYTGYEKSGGRKAAEVVSSALIGGLTGITGGPITGSEGEIQLALIDGNSGDVLWMNRLAGRTDKKRGAAASRGYYGPADMGRRPLRRFLPEASTREE